MTQRPFINHGILSCKEKGKSIVLAEIGTSIFTGSVNSYDGKHNFMPEVSS